jgi:hypothetical protein
VLTVEARVDHWLFKPHTVGVLTKQQGPPDSFTKHMAHETAEAEKIKVKKEEQEAIHKKFKDDLKPIVEENRARGARHCALCQALCSVPVTLLCACALPVLYHPPYCVSHCAVYITVLSDCCLCVTVVLHYPVCCLTTASSCAASLYRVLSHCAVSTDEHKKLQAITKQKQELLREAQINLAAHRLKMAAATGEPIGVDAVPARKPLPYLDSEL